MPVYEELAAHYESRDGSPTESVLIEEEPIWPDKHILRDAEGPTEAEKMARDKAAWRLRISKREVRMFRIRRAGELAMSTTVASLGICATVQSLSENRIEGALIGVMGILWSLGVSHQVVMDLSSPEWTDLVHNTALAREYHDAAITSLEVKPEL